MHEPSWKPVADGSPLLTCTYSFGRGIAKALAAPCDGGYVVVSPPGGATERTFAELEARGKIRALIAPNAYHNVGMAPWHARFPDAAMFAPAQSIPRVEKQGKVAGLRALAHFAALSGRELELIDMPHYRTGEALLRARHGADVAWFVTDVIFNMRTEKLPFPVRQAFEWTKSGPGLRPNGLGTRWMAKDLRAVHRWLRAELEALPPTQLVVAHGEDILGGAADRLRAILPS